MHFCFPFFAASSKSNQEQGSTWLFGAIKDALYGTASAIPPINQAFLQDRSFAHAKLPFCGLKNVCAICTDKSGKGTRVLVASVDGFLYIYDLNVEEGGECTLIKQHKLDESVESVPPPTAQGYLQTGRSLFLVFYHNAHTLCPFPYARTSLIPCCSHHRYLLIQNHQNGITGISYAKAVRGSDPIAACVPSSSPILHPSSPGL